jgi:hypothetical protein
MNSDINSDTQSARAYSEDAATSAQSASNTATAMTNTLAQIEADLSAFETAESGRASAEANRVSAEQARAIAEQARENTETGYVAQARAFAEQAAAHATSDYAQMAKSWAVGNTGGTREDEATNNSKYWSDESDRQRQLSEAWAVGKKNNVDVPDTDDAYHNNSKYWSDQSKMHADDAADSADDAEIAASHYPYIDENTAHWMVWDPATRQYQDSNVRGRGEDGYNAAVFEYYPEIRKLSITFT